MKPVFKNKLGQNVFDAKNPEGEKICGKTMNKELEKKFDEFSSKEYDEWEDYREMVFKFIEDNFIEKDEEVNKIEELFIGGKRFYTKKELLEEIEKKRKSVRTPHASWEEEDYIYNQALDDLLKSLDI